MYFKKDKPKKIIGIMARGALMGAAEIVPGVSGGTIAFVTGIYRELVTSLAAFGRASVPMLGDFRQFAAHHNLRFLISLAVGLVFGVLVVANIIDTLLTYFRPVVWSFFAGAILMSVVVIGRYRRPAMLLTWGSLGVLFGLSLLWLPVPTGDIETAQVFLGAMAAVCAWLLPAISGSYVLLILGLYHNVIRAMANLEWQVLVALGAGVGLGLLLFSRALAWLMRRFPEAVLSLLTGFMLGTLPLLWPWQDDTESNIADRFLTPLDYRDIMGEPSQTWVICLFFVGALALWLLSRAGGGDQNHNDRAPLAEPESKPADS